MSTINFIYWETLSWVVDWVNKVFTSLYPIYQIEDLRLWWVDYTSFTFNWNSVTLTDAPTIATWAPNIDYFRSDTITASITWTVTFLDVVNDFYDRVWQTSLSLVYKLDLVKKYINEGIRVINNMRTNPKYKIGQYSFNKAPDTVVSVYSATQVETPLLSNYVPSSWKIMIWDSTTVNYTSKTWNIFTWISWLNIVYQPWDWISIWYAIPEWVKKISEVLLNKKVLDFVDRREYFIQKNRNVYTIIDWYIFLPYLTSTLDIITVHYIKNNEQLTNDTDIVDIENEYYQVLSLYALYNILMDREDDRYNIQYQKYKDQLRLYKSFLRQIDWINNTISSNIFTRN